jgi:spore germination protein KA
VGLSQEALDFIAGMKEKGEGDLIVKELRQKDYRIHILYFRTLCDGEKILKYVIKPFTEKDTLESFAMYVDALPEASLVTELAGAEQGLYEGNMLIFTDQSVWKAYFRCFQAAPVQESRVESVIQGPQDAFTENLEVNINMVRNRYQRTTLRVQSLRLNFRTRSKAVLIFDEELARPAVLQQLQQSLERLQDGTVQSVGHLQRLLTTRHRWAPFPNMIVTERPDRTVLNLTSGKVVIMLEGEKNALIAPCVFMDFLSSMDDISLRKPVSSFLNALRLTGLFITVTLPAFYVSVTSFNPELFRIQLALVVAGTRSSVPYPSFIEVLFMLLLMEFLAEASVRLPKSIGPAATTVGGLILGQAATASGLVGDIMIIVVSLVAICNFVIPNASMSLSIRVIKYPLLGLASFFGLYGVMAGLIGLLMYMAQLDSFGEPYLRLFQTNRSKY